MNNKPSNISVFIFSIITLLVIVTMMSTSEGENDPSPEGGTVIGDWVVRDERTYEDCSITINGNLTIERRGDLTLRNVTLKMNGTYDGERKIELLDGGQFTISDRDNNTMTTYDRTLICASDSDYHFIFLVRKGSLFQMTNSMLTECGYRKILDYPVNGLFIELIEAEPSHLRGGR